MEQKKRHIDDKHSTSENIREIAGAKQNELKPGNINSMLEKITLDENIEREADEAETVVLAEIHKRIEVEKERKGLSLRFLTVAASLAVIITLSGLILLNGGQPESNLQLITTSTATGVQQEVDLPDGTKVYLNGSTTLVYPENFGKENREVTLNGEAYFDVTQNKNRPFIVNSGNIQVKVLGTTFNVESYPEDESVNVTLATGTVSMNIPTYTDEIVLEPNQQVVYNKISNKVEKLTVNAGKITGWTNGMLYFNGMPLKEITRKLKRHYDVDFIFGSAEIGEIVYTIELDKKESIDDLLHLFSIERRLNFIKENNVITISK